MRYILRRLGFYLIAAWAALTLNFIIPRLMPGDPASTIFAQFRGKMQPEALEALKKAYGFTDAPLIQQYFEYASNVLRGNFGVSVSAFPAPVTSVISTGLVWTLLLGLRRSFSHLSWEMSWVSLARGGAAAGWTTCCLRSLFLSGRFPIFG